VRAAPAQTAIDEPSGVVFKDGVSIRLEMLQVARLAPQILGESASLVREFLWRQLHEEGGFRDRMGRRDLYYTVFGLEGLMAIQAEAAAKRLDRTLEYLQQFGTGDGLDLVHLCSLIRCRATLGQLGQGSLPGDWAAEVGPQLEKFRALDGGFHPSPGAAASTIYATFLAVAALQDLGLGLPQVAHLPRLVEAIQSLRTPDGAWANERRLPAGATNATAAAITLLRNLSVNVDPAVGDWLLGRVHAQGGFIAAPGAPIPDLLSTATALHALSGLQRSLSGIAEPCLDFVDSLWTNEGAFHGHWDDHDVDVEYTYYGLLALGHLSLESAPRK
jgi:prenyltransferase beta subunit